MKLYFKINDKKPEFQGEFDSLATTMNAINLLISTKSTLFKDKEPEFLRLIEDKDNRKIIIDYGAHNAYYIIEDVSDNVFKEKAVL